MTTTIASIQRGGMVIPVSYPAGYSSAKCGCKGCKGQGGDCAQITYLPQQQSITFTLADGRKGSVNVPIGSTDVVITAAISAWANAPAAGADPLIGTAI